MRATLIAALMLLASGTAALAADRQCNDREAVLNLLANKYSEGRVAFGVTNNGGLVEVLKTGPDAKKDTWTIIITTSKGVSCLVAAGEGWREVELVAEDPQT